MEKAMAPTTVLLPGKSHGWRSLVGCSPWGHTESETTERLSSSSSSSSSVYMLISVSQFIHPLFTPVAISLFSKFVTVSILYISSFEVI